VFPRGIRVINRNFCAWGLASAFDGFFGGITIIREKALVAFGQICSLARVEVLCKPPSRVGNFQLFEKALFRGCIA
jgi:hypothetical protein